MNLDDLKKNLKGLDSIFQNKWQIDVVNELTDKILFILDYKPGGSGPCASFALSLDQYNENLFPPKCWITSNSLKSIDNRMPDGEKGQQYKNFHYKNKNFIPYSVGLSEYKPKDIKSIHCLINSLYKHIQFYV